MLVGSDTAGRKWINYEIVKAWTSGLGVVGINIDRVKGKGPLVIAGRNPFDFCRTFQNSGRCRRLPGATTQTA